MKRGPQPTSSSDHLHGVFFFFLSFFCMFPSAENLIVALRDRRDFADERKRTPDETSAEERAGARKLVSVGVNGDSAVINSPWCLT